uniref:Nitrite transporter n=1 Tax=Chloropicon laureae TaxID=464258 RepID=A0A7S2Z4F3_9CHLO
MVMLSEQLTCGRAVRARGIAAAPRRRAPVVAARASAKRQQVPRRSVSGSAERRGERVKVRAASAAPPAAVPPPQVFQSACSTSMAKAKYSWDKTLVLGFLAGSLIGIGALLCSVVAGSSPTLAANNPGLSSFVKGAIGLPAGLAMVILTGAELFTGNVFIMLSGLLTGKVNLADVCKSWFWSFNGNFAGSLFVAAMAFLAQTTSSEALTASVAKVAVAKVSMGFTTLFAKGVLCNWLVCLAVWMAMASNSIPGKLLSIFIPISTFVTLGFEHSVANMYAVSTLSAGFLFNPWTRPGERPEETR